MTGDAARAHREFIEIGLAEHDATGIEQFLRHGRFISRHEIIENMARRRRAHAFGAEQILDRNRNAVQRARFARRAARIGFLRLLQREFRGFGDKGVERGCAFSAPLTCASASSTALNFLASRAAERFGNGEIGQRSFDNFRHGEEIGGAGGRVGENILRFAAVIHDILAAAQILVIDVGQRFDVRDIDFVKLRDPVEDFVELARDLLLLLFGNLQPREMGDFSDGF